MDHRPLLHTTARAATRKDDWWRGAVIYQIYPRSFADSNGDGVGDLPGITARLDHVAGLGVDAIWISPFFKSPMKDFGYDVSDYRDVDPVFGTLADFDALLARAHDLGLRVLIDFVPSHTSNEHAWFTESRASRDNPKADWYVWHDPKPDGSPPTNWMAVFGGSCWEWEPRRGQYYLHNFLKEQPQLNHHNKAMVEALLGEAEFWLMRGVDGFRVDAVDFAVHDPQFRDNPPRLEREVTGGTRGSPYAMQHQTYNKNSPDLAELFLKPFHDLTARYGSTVLLGEISGDYALLRAAEYSEGGGLDIVYTFDLLTCEPSAAVIRGIVEEMEAHVGTGWACWQLCNHDVPRSASRFGGPQPHDDLVKLLPVMLASLRGTVCLYQGEELGLTEAEIAFEDLVDPFGITFWPTFKGRDGCRTPMPWTDTEPGCGFSTGKPWLPIPPEHRARAVSRVAREDGSSMAVIRRFLHWRRTRPELVRGAIRFIEAPQPVLAFVRGEEAAATLCVFNLGAEPLRVASAEPLDPDGRFASEGTRVHVDAIELKAFGFALAPINKKG